MAHKKNTTNLTELLLQCVTQLDPMLSMLKWLCTELMETEVNTCIGTMYLMVPKVRQGGYIPFFVMERKRSEAMLVYMVQEAFVQGVSTRKTEKPAYSLALKIYPKVRSVRWLKGLTSRSRSFVTALFPVLCIRFFWQMHCMKKFVYMAELSAWRCLSYALGRKTVAGISLPLNL